MRLCPLSPLAGAAAVTAVLFALGVGEAVLIGVALMATSLGLVVPVLSDAGVLTQPVGRIALAGASAGEVAAVVLLRWDSRAVTRGWPGGCCCCSARWA